MKNTEDSTLLCESDVSTTFQFSVKNTPDNFLAGKIRKNLCAWLEITSDKWIIDIVKHGYDIEFENEPPMKVSKFQICFNKKELGIMSSEIQKLLGKQVIREISETEVKYVSSIFLRPKKDGSYRLILNLRELNEYVVKRHFKMETLKSVLAFVTPDCFFGSLDIKDAYFSIPVSLDSQGWLAFYWDKKFFAFTVLPNGLGTAPRVYTKMLKPVFSSLRKMGFCNSTYIDDSLLKSEDKHSCSENILQTLELVDNLGFTVHPKKSILVPTQEIVFVGFVINSIEMTVRLTQEKAHDIYLDCIHLIQQKQLLIRDAAKLIGKFVASEPGVRYAALYYKTLEIEKDNALKLNRGNFDTYMTFSQEAKECLQWWIDNIKLESKPIIVPQADIIIESDSSMQGWGAINKTSHEIVSGFWSDKEKDAHINVLEMKAAYLALQQFCSSKEGIHIKLYLDNTVAIKYLNKMGGRKSLLNKLTKDIWGWCLKRRLWISVFHIPGKDNYVADRLSRKMNEDMEWSLSQEVFLDVQANLGALDIDLFASRDNHKLDRYVSYLPDSKAVAVNAFSLTWTNNSFLFPPFSLLGLVLQKIQQDRATVVLVAPVFHTQPWFPTLLRMICHQPFLLPKPESCLSLPKDNQKRHPLTKMRLGCFKISGTPSLVREYQKILPTLSSHHGGSLPKNNIGRIYEDGCFFVIGKKLINLIPLSKRC